MQNKYRYYTYDYLIGQHLLTIDTQENKYRFDSFNLHGQCYTLGDDWKKITKATLTKALKGRYVIDRYVLQHFSGNSNAKSEMKELLYKSNNFDDCILFLVHYGKENQNCMNNKQFNYYKEYMEDKTKNLDDFLSKLDEKTSQFEEICSDWNCQNIDMSEPHICGISIVGDVIKVLCERYSSKTEDYILCKNIEINDKELVEKFLDIDLDDNDNALNFITELNNKIDWEKTEKTLYEEEERKLEKIQKDLNKFEDFDIEYN